MDPRRSRRLCRRLLVAGAAAQPDVRGAGGGPSSRPRRQLGTSAGARAGVRPLLDQAERHHAPSRLSLRLPEEAMIARATVFAVAATLGLSPACAPASAPPRGQLLFYVTTDAPLPPAPGARLDPNEPVPLFD